MVQLVQPLQGGEQPEDLAEPLRLQLAELQQVQRRRDERERQHGEAQDADGDVQNRPRAAPHHRARLRHQTDEQGQPDESRGERPREDADSGRPKRRLTRHLNSARNSASMESVGATPMNGVSRATPSACAAMPASGTPKSRPRGARRSPAKGASTNTVATAYRPRATK